MTTNKPTEAQIAKARDMVEGHTGIEYSTLLGGDYKRRYTALEQDIARAIADAAEQATKKQTEYHVWILGNYIAAWEEAAQENPIIQAKIDVIRAHKEAFESGDSAKVDWSKP